MEGLTIRTAQPADLQAMVAITRASPEAAQWSDAEFARIAAGALPQTQAWIGEVTGQVTGFIVTRLAADEIEILNIAVEVSRRGAGIGGAIVEHTLAEARTAGAMRAFLEVRESNDAAIDLYLRHGFCPAGRREKYYTAPVETALILARNL